MEYAEPIDEAAAMACNAAHAKTSDEAAASALIALAWAGIAIAQEMQKGRESR